MCNFFYDYGYISDDKSQSYASSRLRTSESPSNGAATGETVTFVIFCGSDGYFQYSRFLLNDVLPIFVNKYILNIGSLKNCSAFNGFFTS